MTLLEVRKLFVQFSGRYDLVHSAEAYEDNGANALIRAGLRYLSGAVVCPTEQRMSEYALAAGVVGKTIPYARAIHSVALTDEEASGGWRVLDRIDVVRLANEFKDAEATETPTFWALRGAETTITDGYEKRYLDYFDPALSYAVDLMVYIGPPCSQALTLRVEGLFEETLENEHSECWWSIKHPMILVTAALMWAEVFNRNNEGVVAFMHQIEALTLSIAKDQVTQNIAEHTQMRPSW